MSSWPYPYCPHMAFNKNIKIRMASIPYSFVPDPTIDAFTNVNIKCANLQKHNIPSLAYEEYFTGQYDSNTNFAKDYYKQCKNVDNIKFDNNVVEQKKKEMDQGSAYALASQATKEYQQFEQNRKNALDNAHRRAISVLRTHQIQKEEEKKQANKENSDWLKKLYRKLQEIAKHIVNGEGESLEQKQKMFLLSKANITPNYLSQIKVKNPQTACQILEELKTLMLKKKLKFQNEREEQEKNKSVTVSMMSQTSQNASQGSMLSQATTINQSHIDGEQELITKFCDFQNLSKKWRLTDVSQVKYLLRLLLTRKYVSEATVSLIKKKREAEIINKSLQKLIPQSAKKAKPEKQNKDNNKKSKPQSKPKRAQTTQKIKPNSSSPDPKDLKSTGLSKQQELVKQKLINGGHFDAIGEKFARNRNFSTLFSKKQQQIMVQFSVKEQKGSNKTTPLSKQEQPTLTFTP